MSRPAPTLDAPLASSPVNIRAAVYRCDSTCSQGYCASAARLLFSAYMEHLFIFLGVLQILAGLYLVYEAAKWLSYARRRAGTDPGFYSPRTAGLCPGKGIEPGLERNLTALCDFDHQNYAVFFILASKADPAPSMWKRVAWQP